jgi:phosphoglycolate phosphatase-like HAD superfamily hydrolase
MKIEGLKTLFIDIDGTLLHHHGYPNKQTVMPTLILPGVIEKFGEWNTKGYYIILVTGRRESERAATIKQLEEAGIVYDVLITGVSRGERVIINDTKPDSDWLTARAICVKRNTGISDIEL